MRFHYVKRSLPMFFFAVGSLLLPLTEVWGFGNALKPSNRDEKLSTPECVKSRSGRDSFSSFQKAADRTEVYAFENIFSGQSRPCSGRIVLTKPTTEVDSHGLNILIPDSKGGVEEYSGLVPELPRASQASPPMIYALEVNSKGSTTEMIEFLIRRKDDKDASYIDELFAIDKPIEGPLSNPLIKLVTYVNHKPKANEISGIYYKKKGQGADEGPGYVIEVFRGEGLPKHTFRLLETKSESVLWVTPVNEPGQPGSPLKLAIFTRDAPRSNVIKKYEITLPPENHLQSKKSQEDTYIKLSRPSLARKASPEEISRLSFKLIKHSVQNDSASESLKRIVSPELLGQ